MGKDQLILQFVKRVRKRLCFQTFFKWFLYAASAGLIVWGIMNTISCFVPFYGAVLYGFFAFLIIMIAGSLISIRFFPNLRQTAFRVDATGLKERVTTSMDLKGKDDVCSTIVKDDTIRHINNYPTKQFFPTKVSKRMLLILFLCAAFVLSTAMIPAKMKDQAKLNHEMWNHQKEMKKQFEEMQEEIEEKYDLTKEQKELLENIIEEAKDEVDGAKTNEELQKIEERLKNKIESQITNPIEFGDAAKRLQDELTETEGKTMTESEQQKIADELEKLAEQTQDDELKEQAEKMQQELQENHEITEETMKQAQEKLEQFQKEQQEFIEQQKQQQQQQEKQHMSRENAEQMLNAAMQEEKATQDRMKKAQQQQGRRKLQKNW